MKFEKELAQTHLLCLKASDSKDNISRWWENNENIPMIIHIYHFNKPFHCFAYSRISRIWCGTHSTLNSFIILLYTQSDKKYSVVWPLKYMCLRKNLTVWHYTEYSKYWTKAGSFSDSSLPNTWFHMIVSIYNLTS